VVATVLEFSARQARPECAATETVADVSVCAGCASLLRKRGIVLALDNEQWVYEAATPAATEHLDEGWRRFDQRLVRGTLQPAWKYGSNRTKRRTDRTLH
jgi:hypothetical protein